MGLERRRRGLLLSALLLAGLTVAASGHAGEPKVVVSIKPIHALVAGVMQGVGEPKLLIKGAASPHSYALRPSDARALAAADLIFWVGAGLEAFLRKPLAVLPKGGKVVALAQAPGVTVLPVRKGGVWATHADDHAGHGDETRGRDMHIWLDPANAKAMVAAIAAALGTRDPGNAATYKTNADRMRQRLVALEAELRQALTPVRDRPYIVFHDAYQYFERRFELHAAGAITVSPDRAPGAKRLSEIRERILKAGALCVFSEPQFEPKLVRTITAGTSAKTAVLDPIGAPLPPGPEAYFALMRGLADAIRACLASAE